MTLFRFAVSVLMMSPAALASIPTPKINLPSADWSCARILSKQEFVRALGLPEINFLEEGEILTTAERVNFSRVLESIRGATTLRRSEQEASEIIAYFHDFEDLLRQNARDLFARIARENALGRRENLDEFKTKASRSMEMAARMATISNGEILQAREDHRFAPLELTTQDILHYASSLQDLPAGTAALIAHYFAKTIEQSPLPIPEQVNRIADDIRQFQKLIVTIFLKDQSFPEQWTRTTSRQFLVGRPPYHGTTSVNYIPVIDSLLLTILPTYFELLSSGKISNTQLQKRYKAVSQNVFKSYSIVASEPPKGAPFETLSDSSVMGAANIINALVLRNRTSTRTIDTAIEEFVELRKLLSYEVNNSSNREPYSLSMGGIRAGYLLSAFIRRGEGIPKNVGLKDFAFRISDNLEKSLEKVPVYDRARKYATFSERGDILDQLLAGLVEGHYRFTMQNSDLALKIYREMFRSQSLESFLISEGIPESGISPLLIDYPMAAAEIARFILAEKRPFQNDFVDVDPIVRRALAYFSKGVPIRVAAVIACKEGI